MAESSQARTRVQSHHGHNNNVLLVEELVWERGLLCGRITASLQGLRCHLGVDGSDGRSCCCALWLLLNRTTNRPRAGAFTRQNGVGRGKAEHVEGEAGAPVWKEAEPECLLLETETAGSSCSSLSGRRRSR
jgi:hypothetical protein